MPIAHRPNALRAVALTSATIAAALFTPCSAPAQQPASPVYARSRAAGYFPNHANWNGYGGFGGYGYYQPWLAPPVVAGTWYARPYPYHFDYYRGRWNGGATSSAVVDCPCAEAIRQDAP